MTPSPHEADTHNEAPNLSGDRVVISGMSGLYPKARNVKDFTELLYNKVDPITTENPRWDFKHPDLYDHIGMIPGLNKFDSQFFKLSHRSGSTVDVMSRKLMEQTYQAIYDAGLSPEHLAGKNTGVFVAACFSETAKACFYDDGKIGSGLIGCSKTMFANRISYWLDVKGPSYTLDQSCCSSIGALEAAYKAVQRGECENAIVAAGALCLHPQTMIHFGRLITFSPNGKTKSFDETADGCVRSEAINVLFLQRAKDALRIYADVVNVQSAFTAVVEGEKGPKYGFYREVGVLTAFLKEFYNKANVSPNAVEYIDAHGAGDKEVDKTELDAFEQVFCVNRKNPLIVGSVMSNIGYTEAASGVASITKVLLGYQKGKIAANLYCEKPRQDIPALKDKRMIIATDHQPIQRSYAAINNMSYNGINAHVLLSCHFKHKELDRYKSALPRLVTVSGRHEKAVKRIFDDLKSRPLDPEELALLHNIHEKRINGHLSRGYTILDANSNDKSLGEKVEYFDDVERPLWFVYSGMGSQWNSMGLQLMSIPVFAATIKRCHEVLRPKGLDLMHILTTEDKSIFNNILHAFVGITAVQIALTDVLSEIGITPDKIIGHSLGEIACAYVDGCFTAEEAILASYARGRVSIDIPVIKGCMAAVGLGYQQIKDMCPNDIYVACHNGPDSCTLSGPHQSVKTFIESLTSQGIFAKEVQTCNIAYHSKYIENMSELHLKLLKEIIKTSVARSERWISTSVPQDKWDEDIAKYSSPDYHNNNMANAVLFEESLKLVPPNAVLIEIAPHGLLQAILKRSLPSNCHHIPLTRRGHDDNTVHLLNAIGSIYMEGYHPQVAKLYPKVDFPVSTETSTLSHLVEWNHDEQWNMPLYIAGEKRTSSATKHLITLHDEETTYLRGNIVRGRVVYPYAAALVAVWDTLAMFLGVEKKSLSVHFKDVHLFAQPLLHEQRQLKLNVHLHRGTGKFEVSDESSKMATGYIIGNLTDLTLPKVCFESTEPLDLEAKDIYELLEERDYSYKDEFRTIHKANVSLTEAQLLWTDNWVTFIDGILQLNALRVFHGTVCQPTYIRRICIDVDEHLSKIKTSGNQKVVTVNISDVHKLTKCGGMLWDDIKFHKLPPLIEHSATLKTVQFLPYFQSSTMNINSALEILCEILRENVNEDELKVVGVICDTDETIFNEFKDLIKNIPIKINYCEISERSIQENKQILSKTDLVLIKNLSTNLNVLEVLCDFLRPTAFVLNYNSRIYEESFNTQSSLLYRVVTSINTGEILLELVKLGPEIKNIETMIPITSQDDVSKLNLKLKSLPPNESYRIVAIASVLPGLKEQVKKWRKEFGNSKVSMITIDKNVTEDESLKHIPEFAFSVLKNGVWGGEYQMPWKERFTVSQRVILQSTRIGDLQSLKWVEASEPNKPGIVVDVHYAGLNDCDAKRALGVISFKDGQEFVYGMDFSGKTESGTSVMGVISSGAIGSKVVACPELLWDVPLGWSLEEAATVPLAYSMAFYYLKLKADITNGLTILIMGGAGALGQALISIALAYDCKVFTTVSDHNKKQLLLKLFPQLDENNIFYSRDLLFGDMVLRATKGEGCDVVFTCATGALREAALNCCGFSGVTIDVVQLLSNEKFSFGLSHLSKQRAYMAVDFSSVFDYVDDMKVIKELVSEGIEKGYVRPITYVTYDAKHVVSAFKLSESTRRSGRVLINLRDSALEAEYRFTCNPNNWQIVLCDDVIGVQIVEKLINHGARQLILNCPNQFGHLEVKKRSWAKLGADVEVSTMDLTKPDLVDSILQNVTRKGQLEGLFVFLTNTKNTELETTISKLDDISRKLCPSLKHFVIASTEQSFGRKVYLTRIQDQLPVTVIHLPPLQKVNSKLARSSSSRRVAIDAILKTFISPTANVTVHLKENKPTSLLRELASIAGIEIPTNVYVDTTLQDLGIFDKNKTSAIKAYLRDVHNKYYEENVIPSLTVQQILDIENTSSWHAPEDLKGLQIFFSHFGSDEVLASVPTVTMKTRAKYWREYEFDVNITSLCIIPGFEGHHEPFQLMCDRLKLPAFTIQPGYDNPQESIKQISQRYAQVLTKKMKIKDNFYLLGYESGVLLALETARILETSGRKGTIFCVGQTPEELQTTVENIIQTLSKDGLNLEDAVAKHVVNLIKQDSKAFAKIESEVKAAPHWKEKLEICVEELVGHNGHTSQYIADIINTALGRITQLRSYKIEPFKLASKIVLLHSASLVDPTSMQLFSKQPIVVHEIDSPLGHIKQDLRCTSIINQHLGQDVLDLFEENNLCEPNFLNCNTFDFVPYPDN